jgi:hypothetical protein
MCRHLGPILIAFLTISMAPGWVLGGDASPLLNRLSDHFADIKSLRCDLKEKNTRIGDLENRDSTTRILSESSSSLVWDSARRFSFRSTSRASGREIPQEILYLGQKFLIGFHDPQTAPAVTSCLKPSWDKPEIAFELSAHPLSFLLGFQHKDFSPKDRGLVSLTKVIGKGGTLRSQGDGRLEWIGDRYAIHIELDTSNNNFRPTRIEYRLLKTPTKSEPRVVTSVSADFKDYKDYGGTPFPSKLIVERNLSEGLEFDGEKRPASRTTSEVEFSSIRLNEALADTDFSFAMKVPDYTPVRMIDAEQLHYYWLKGEIVPATDDEAARIAKNAAARRLGSKGGWTKFLWIAGLSTIALVLVFLFERARRGRG